MKFILFIRDGISFQIHLLGKSLCTNYTVDLSVLNKSTHVQTSVLVILRMLSSLLIVITFLVFLVKWFLDQKKLPPGPKRIPFIGSLPFITTKKGVGDWTLDEDVTKHKVSTVQIGLGNTFVINDFELAKVRD